MKKIVLPFLVLLSSCDGIQVNSEFSDGLNATFKMWKDGNDCKTAKIDEYTYKGKLVYAFDPGMCGADMFTPIADADGKVFCNLGGIMGNVKCDGEAFDKNASLKRTVWKAN